MLTSALTHNVPHHHIAQQDFFNVDMICTYSYNSNVDENIFVAGGWLAGLTIICSVTTFLHDIVDKFVKIRVYVLH